MQFICSKYSLKSHITDWVDIVAKFGAQWHRCVPYKAYKYRSRDALYIKGNNNLKSADLTHPNGVTVLSCPYFGQNNIRYVFTTVVCSHFILACGAAKVEFATMVYSLFVRLNWSTEVGTLDVINMMTSSNGNIFLRYWPFVRGIHRWPYTILGHISSPCWYIYVYMYIYIYIYIYQSTGWGNMAKYLHSMSLLHIEMALISSIYFLVEIKGITIVRHQQHGLATQGARASTATL